MSSKRLTSLKGSTNSVLSILLCMIIDAYAQWIVKGR